MWWPFVVKVLSNNHRLEPQAARRSSGLFVALLQETLKASYFRFKFHSKSRVGWFRLLEAGLDNQSPAWARHVHPSDHVVSPEHRHCVIAKLPLCSRNIRLESIPPIPEVLESLTIPNKRIERRH